MTIEELREQELYFLKQLRDVPFGSARDKFLKRVIGKINDDMAEIDTEC